MLPRRLWAFTATRWVPRRLVSSVPGHCRAFCCSRAPLIVQVTTMTSCFTTCHSTRLRSPGGTDEGWVAKLCTYERFATQDRRTCPAGFMVSVSLAIPAVLRKRRHATQSAAAVVQIRDGQVPHRTNRATHPDGGHQVPHDTRQAQARQPWPCYRYQDLTCVGAGRRTQPEAVCKPWGKGLSDLF